MINGVKPSPCIAKKNEGNVLLKLELHWFYSHYVYKYASYCVQFNSIELRAKMSSAAKCMQFRRIYNPLQLLQRTVKNLFIACIFLTSKIWLNTLVNSNDL